MKQHLVELKRAVAARRAQVSAAVLGLVVAGQASAASVLTVEMETALTAGFTDLKDTATDLIATAWPFVIGIAVVLMAPKIVQKLLHMAGR